MYKFKSILEPNDLVVSDIFKTFEGFPYVIRVKSVDSEFKVITFNHKGEEMYISTQSLRPATKFERFFGPIYDFLIK